MSIGKCMDCPKNRRSARKYHHLFTSDCIGCSTENGQERIISTQKWEEICLTPKKANQNKSFQSPKTPGPVIKCRSQYLQIGYIRPTKQHWGAKAFHIFGHFTRRRNSSVQNSFDQSKESSEPSSGVETTEKRSETDCEIEAVVEIGPTNQTHSSAHSTPTVNPKFAERSKTRVIGPANKNFDDGQESSVDVLALMQRSENRPVPVPASDQTLSLKCCCSDADLTKPSMCGDRACITCSVHDHRLIARQVPMEAEAAAQAAASVLAVPRVQADRNNRQLSYTSAASTPCNNAVQDVLHSVRYALESRSRLLRSERLNHQPTSNTVVHTEAATCTTPPTQEPAIKPILLTLGKMYQKNLYISALLHNLSSLDVKKLVGLVNECRTKIDQLEEVCKQKIEPHIVGAATEQKKETVDVAVGEVNVYKQTCKPVTVDAGVGEEDVRKEKLDKETQDVTNIVKLDSQTETANIGVEAGVQVSGDEMVGARGVRGPDYSIGSDDQWRRMSQLSGDLSTADVHSLSYCHSYLLDPFMMQFESLKPENSLSEVPASIADHRQQVTAASKAYSLSSQKLRQFKPSKLPVRPPMRRASLLASSPSRLRTTKVRQALHSPPRQGVPPAAIQTHPVLRQQHAPAVAARFAGGRSVMNNFPLRRGLSVNKPSRIKVVSTLQK